MLKIAFKENYVLDLPAGHRFPMEKYDLLPKQLLFEGLVNEENFFAPDLPQDLKFILTVHDEKYLNDLKNLSLTPREQRKTGFPHSTSLYEREITIMEGTRKCAEYALESGISMNIAGGTHHAYSNKGEGFCLLNDQAVAAQWLLDNKLARKILIVDLDVHQGNGTAEIFQNSSDVFTFSMHGKNNYPLHKEISDLDIELEDNCGDREYLNKLNTILPELIKSQKPDFIFYQSGVDVIATDKLGRLGLSIQGCKERDTFVLESCKQNNIPVVCTMGGGYSPQIKHIIEAHANTFREAQRIYF